jgi:hypothetical protein
MNRWMSPRRPPLFDTPITAAGSGPRDRAKDFVFADLQREGQEECSPSVATVFV